MELAATTGALAVVGDPGAGKSSLLCELAKKLDDGSSTVLVLRASELGARSIGLLRDELGLHHDLEDVLRASHTKSRAYLLIDALDATRGDAGKAKAMRQLIELARVPGANWNVVATIRRFDLLWSPDWRRVFRAPKRDNGELGEVSHVDVGVFDDHELSQIAVAAPDLAAVVNAAPPSLRELLRVPFNLRLAAELALDSDAMASIRTQLDLLDRYWLERIEGGNGGEARVRTMREIATHALDQKTTRVERSIVSSATALEELEHAGVLLRNGEHIEAAHHVVLDYAIARTLFSSANAGIGRLILPETAIFYRQSVSMALERMWREDRTSFWHLLFEATSKKAPGAARVAISEVLISKTSGLSDLHPLLQQIQREASPGAGAHVFHFLHGTMLGSAPGTDNQSVWFEFIAELATCAIDDVLWHAARLLENLFRDGRAPATDATAARASRALLAASWARSPDNRNLIGWSARCVIRSFRAAPSAAAILLRRALNAQQRPAYADDVVSLMAESIEELFDVPSLVSDTYAFVLGREARAQRGNAEAERTRQTDDHPRWSHEAWKLDQEIGRFFDVSPSDAARGVARAAVACAPFRLFRPGTTTEFRVLGQTQEVDDSPVTLMNGDIRELDQLVGRFSTKFVALAATDVQQAVTVLHVLANEMAPPSIWGSLLRDAAAEPASVALMLDILAEPTALRLLAEPAGEFIRLVRDDLTQEQRVRIEEAINLITPDPIGSESRDRLHSALAGTALREPPEIPMLVRESIQAVLLAERGMSQDEIRQPANVAVQELEARADEVRAELLDPGNSRPRPIARGAEILRTLVEVLQTENAHEAQRRSGWGTAAQLATAMTRLGERATLDVLVTASRHSEPMPDPDLDRRFARSPSWGTGFARIEAAEGLALHATRWGTPEALDALGRLAVDSSAAVRYQVANALGGILKQEPAFAWALVERLASDDNSSVACAALDEAWQFFGQDQERTIATILQALEAANRARVGHERVQARCWSLLTMIYVHYSNAAASAAVDRLIASIEENVPAVESLLHDLRSALRSDAEAGSVRARAIGLFARLASKAVEAVALLGESDAALNASLRAERPPLSRLIGELAQQIYFASGAFTAGNASPPPSEHRLRILADLQDTIRLLGTSGIVEASEHILDTLDAYAGVDGIDPVSLLTMFLDIARSAVAHGYQFGWRGFDVIDRTIRWYLAEHPDVLTAPENVRTLSDIIDAFLDAGWPAAFRLARELGHVR